MAHQLKVERSKSCGQLFPLSKGFYLVNFPPKKDFLRFRTPSARRSITVCSHGALRYQRAAGEMASHTHLSSLYTWERGWKSNLFN